MKCPKCGGDMRPTKHTTATVGAMRCIECGNVDFADNDTKNQVDFSI